LRDLIKLALINDHAQLNELVGVVFQWTTEKDIEDATKSLGINDFIEVKFFENRANGQSKGFCVLTVGSESSAKILMDRLGLKDLHGTKPVVLPNTKQSIAQVECYIFTERKRAISNNLIISQQ
jgi:cleavage and polyadenylation specificity factor subunit 6/7